MIEKNNHEQIEGKILQSYENNLVELEQIMLFSFKDNIDLGDTSYNENGDGQKGWIGFFKI